MTDNRVKLILGGDREIKETVVTIKGSGGKLGMAAVKQIESLMNKIKTGETPEEIAAATYVVIGYILCCCNCNFVLPDGAEYLIGIAQNIAEKEIKRKERQEGTKSDKDNM